MGCVGLRTPHFWLRYRLLRTSGFAPGSPRQDRFALEALILLLHEFADRASPLRAAILTEKQSLTMDVAVVFARQKPSRVDAAFVNQRRDDVDDEGPVGSSFTLIEKSCEIERGDLEHVRGNEGCDQAGVTRQPGYAP